MFKNIRRVPVPCGGFTKPVYVTPGLAVTPSEVASLTEKGIAVNAVNAGALSVVDGVSDPVLLLENTRGIDVSDVWNASLDARANLIRAHKKDKEYYG